jgi:formylglycine-generating enzyme required for sulfatase activity
MRVLPALRARAAVSFFIIVASGAGPLLQAQEKSSIDLDLGAGRKLELIRIDPGTFEQGSPENEPGRGSDEAPRRVTLTKPFLLGKFPVTRGQFARFVSETHYRTDAETGPSGGFGWDGAQLTQRKQFTWRDPGFPQTDDHPVTLVDTRDARAFLDWLSRKTGRPFALPSEAQWEYAARADSAEIASTADSAWHHGNSGNTTHPVGEMPLNAWGLGDMLGNVWQWCDDWYAPYSPGDATDPLQTDSSLSDKPRRILRGGSWLRDAKFCRPAARYRNDPLSRNADNGFRVMTFQVEAPIPRPPTAATPPSTPINLRVSGEVASTPRPLFVDSPAASVPSVTRETTSLAWLAILPFLALALLVVGFIVRTFTRAVSSNLGGRGGIGGGFPGMPGPPMRINVADDGFWILANGLAAGSVIFCRYETNGISQQMDVTYNPGPQGQFVFTGTRPSKVTVTHHRGVSPGPYSSLYPDTTTSGQLHVDPPFRGHPSAY